MPAADIPTVWVWPVALAQPAAQVQRAAALLAPDEQARVTRFFFDRDRERYILSRAALRLILGRCLDQDPAALTFAYGPAGKPSLALPPAAAPLHFNLAHSHELALVAVTRGAAVGVDVEYARELKELETLASRFFSPREAERLLALPSGQRPAAFFRCWSRKEAYLKALGTGIPGGLDRFDVSFEPGEPAALLATLDDPAEAARWSLHDVVVPAGYAGAVAVAAPAARLVVEPWPIPQHNL